MKAQLTFNLPDEDYLYESAINGHKYKSVLIELNNMLRNKLKYCDLSDQEYSIYETVKSFLWEELSDRKIDLYDTVL